MPYAHAKKRKLICTLEHRGIDAQAIPSDPCDGSLISFPLEGC
nr:MAG TPA: hypothetical protein [Bacteriophage sp.]